MAIVHPPVANRPIALIEPQAGEGLLGIAADNIAALYKQHGALLLRGFPPDIDAFRRFADQFCSTSVFNESPGRRAIDAEHNILTVDGGVRAFVLHPELSREPWKPDVAFFHCLLPPKHGGATTICDGVALAQNMPRAVQGGLSGRRLVYIKATWPDFFAYWLGTFNPSESELANPPKTCPYRFARLDGQTVRIFSRSALHRPMFIDAPAFGNFLLFARFNNNRPGFPLLDDGSTVPDEWLFAIRDTGNRLTFAIQWEAGDLLMIDNTRFMHGRTAISNPSERLIATYFGYLRFAEPDPDEPIDAPWRKPGFQPPIPPDLPR